MWEALGYKRRNCAAWFLESISAAVLRVPGI